MKIEALYKAMERLFLSVSLREDIYEPELNEITILPLQLSGLGSFNETCMALLCTYVGHRGAKKKKDFPQNSADRQYKRTLHLQ